MSESMDKSLNIGSEVELFEGCVKHVRIGNIRLIRDIRQKMKDVRFRFSYCIGRDKIKTETGEEVDFPMMETTYREAFNMVLVEGMTDDEYEQVNEHGIKELDNLLDRFL